MAQLKQNQMTREVTTRLVPVCKMAFLLSAQETVANFSLDFGSFHN